MYVDFIKLTLSACVCDDRVRGTRWMLMQVVLVMLRHRARDNMRFYYYVFIDFSFWKNM